MNNKISVIIPVYNVENYLHRCVDSIINQTYKKLEIILINDGSLDNSGKICDEYAISDSRIIVIHKKNEGSSCARNAGLKIATGDFISFVDSDDFLEKSMIKSMLDKLLKYDLSVIEIKPKSKSQQAVSNDQFEIEDQLSATQRVIQTTAFAVWRRMYKSTLIKDLRFIPKIIHQDVFFTIDVLNRIDRLGYLENELYNYNTENTSVIRSKYSLEKITIGIRATEYIIKNTAKHPILQQTISNYITSYYTDHYFLISRNTDLDPNRIYRKKLRHSVKKNLSFKNYGLRSLMVIILPYKFMEFISSAYKELISS